MRKAALIPLVVIAVLALSGIGHAADLQAGWYAKIQGVNVYTYGEWGPSLIGDAHFYETPVGQYGPLLVSDPYGADFARWVTVPNNAYSVGPEATLIMPLAMPVTQGTTIAFLDLAWATNYDSRAMYLQLWQQSQTGLSSLIWEQKLSGIQGSGEGIAYDTVCDGQYYFTLNVLGSVPEPSGLACLLVGLLPLSRVAKGRR